MSGSSVKRKKTVMYILIGIVTLGLLAVLIWPGETVFLTLLTAHWLSSHAILHIDGSVVDLHGVPQNSVFMIIARSRMGDLWGTSTSSRSEDEIIDGDFSAWCWFCSDLQIRFYKKDTGSADVNARAWHDGWRRNQRVVLRSDPR